MGANNGILTIDLDAVAGNYAILQARAAPGCRAGAALKANAYGLGAAQVAPVLYDAGCRDFFVATPEEAADLKDLPADARIIVLNGYYASAADLYAQRGLIPALGSFSEIEGFKTLAARLGRSLPAYLSFNTRMNRLGLGTVETEKLLGDLSMLDSLEIAGVMSHFACADEPDHPMNEEQYQVFADIARHFPRAAKSLANSSGIFRDRKYHFDLVRPGMALYGLNPVPEQENPMQPVVSLNVPVIRTRLVYKDARIGYNATYRFDKDSWVATLSAGYADGLFRSLSNRGVFYWQGIACPVRGRISMDLISVDLSAVPEGKRPKPGDMMEVIGPHQSADDLAAQAGTIGYEILTALGPRYRRDYIGQSRIPALASLSS